MIDFNETHQVDTYNGHFPGRDDMTFALPVTEALPSPNDGACAYTPPIQPTEMNPTEKRIQIENIMTQKQDLADHSIKRLPDNTFSLLLLSFGNAKQEI